MSSKYVRVGAIIAVVAALSAWAILSGGVAAILKYKSEILHLTQQHIMLVAYSGGPAIVVGVILGILLTRRRARRICEPVMQVLSIATAIPTLAIIALAMMALGVGRPPALVALFLHALLPIVRNTVEGLRQLPPPELECARGMGMTPSQTLFLVELPEALPIIAQGVRVALVVNVGVAPLAYLVGGGGLGDLIFSGIDLFEPAMMLAGAIPTAALAVSLDFLLSRLTRLLVSPGIRNHDAIVTQN
ncbi:MAG: ABC transporter permease [Betaproteobacteria bacterium]